MKGSRIRAAARAAAVGGLSAGLSERLEDRVLFAVLPYGSVVPGEIAAAGEVDEFTFSAQAGHSITIGLTSTAVQANFDAFAALIPPPTAGTPNPDPIATFFATGHRRFDLDVGGTYRLRVNDSNRVDRGRYAVALEGIKPPSPGPTPLNKGGIVGGKIDQALEVDQFTFSGAVNQRVTLALTSAATDANFDAFVEVFAPSGAPVDDFFATGQRELPKLAENGTYLVSVHDSNYADRGTYTIGFEGIRPISPNPAALVRGGIVPGEILNPIEVDQFTFAGRAGERISLALTSTAVDANFDAFANLYAPSGQNLQDFFARGQSFITLEENGTYMVQVHDSNFADEGRYTVGLESVSPPSPDALSIIPQRATPGEINAANEVDQFTLFAQANDQVEITLTSTAVDANFDAFLEVFDGDDGAEKVEFFGGRRTVTIDNTGLFTVQVRDSNFADKGRYSVTLRWVTAGRGAVAGTVFRDANKSRGRDAAEPGLAGVKVYLDADNDAQPDANERSTVTDVLGNYAFTALPFATYNVRAVQPAGNFLGTPTAGKHTATVNAATPVTGRDFGYATSPYGPDPDDQITEAKPLAATAGGSSTIGQSVESATDVDIYRIVAAEGDRVTFDIDRPAGSNLDSVIRLFTEAGVRLGGNDNGIAPGETADNKSSYLDFTFSAAGTYYLGVSGKGNSAYNAVTGDGDAPAATTGAYTLVAKKVPVELFRAGPVITAGIIGAAGGNDGSERIAESVLAG